MCQEEEDGAQAGPPPLLLPRPVYLAKFRAQGPFARSTGVKVASIGIQCLARGGA